MNRNQTLSDDQTDLPIDPEKHAAKAAPPEMTADSPPDANSHAAISFHSISGGLNEVIIEHEGHKYRLRSTRNGRLLLNK